MTDDRRAPDTPDTPSTGAETSSLGGLFWLAVVVAGLAATAVAMWAVPWGAAAIGTAAILLTAWMIRPAANDSGRGASVRLGTRRRTTWPEGGMKTVVEALDDPCILIDATGMVRYVNAAAHARFNGIRLGDPLSFRLRVTLLHDALDRVVAFDRAETVEWQEKVPTERWLEAHLAPIHFPPNPPGDDSRPDFVLLRIEDLTERHRVERMRADFVANASHELRTPLAAVIGFLETLQGPARNDDKVRDKFLGIMAEQAGRMKRLIDDLLSLSRLEMRAHLRPETTVDLSELLRFVLDLVAPATSAASVEVTLTGCEAPRPVRGDREELVQVFTNLIENAVKYGGAGGRVEVSVVEIGDGRHLRVAVRDHGPGIDPVHLPRLTERFYRAHTDKTGERRGTGLGLAIVKHIVTRHGGRLDIESKPGDGSTFTIRLDRSAPAVADENSLPKQ